MTTKCYGALFFRCMLLLSICCICNIALFHFLFWDSFVGFVRGKCEWVQILYRIFALFSVFLRCWLTALLYPRLFYVITYMLFQYPVIAVVFCIFNFVLCYYMIIFSTPSPWFNVFDILFLCCKIIAYIPLFLCFHVYITYSAVLYCLMVLVIQPASWKTWPVFLFVLSGDNHSAVYHLPSFQ